MEPIRPQCPTVNVLVDRSQEVLAAYSGRNFQVRRRPDAWKNKLGSIATRPGITAKSSATDLPEKKL